MAEGSGKLPWWDRTAYARRRAALKLRAQAITAIRAFFSDRDFIEVETSALQVSPGIERHIRPLKVALNRPFGGNQMERYLHTSPEFAMKKLLAAGEPRLFQMTHVFRDAEAGPLHHPEFTMLEWYEADADYKSLMSLAEDLIKAVCRKVEVPHLRYGSQSCDPFVPWRRITVSEAFESILGVDLLSSLSSTDGDVEKGETLLTQAGLGGRSGLSWEDAFHHIMLERIEPAFADGPPFFLYDYPSPLAALARPKPGNDLIAERVELYVCGVELANGFSELTDQVEQSRRFERDIAFQRQTYGEGVPVDEDFLAALGRMPDAAGMALGIDRLAMLIAGVTDIRDVLWAPVEMPEGP